MTTEEKRLRIEQARQAIDGAGGSRFFAHALFGAAGALPSEINSKAVNRASQWRRCGLPDYIVNRHLKKIRSFVAKYKLAKKLNTDAREVKS